MNDLETMKAMLKKAKIDFTEEIDDGVTTIRVEKGYFGFFTDITFDSAGSLTDMAAWE